jgi:lycopene cyclase domain-containing protein
MSLYGWLNLLSVSVPLIASFHPRIKLYRYWKSIFLAIAIAMAPYMVWDFYFTRNGYWGFNKSYVSNAFLLGLPLDEWLFFVCIPFACIFTHISIRVINKDLLLSYKLVDILTLSLFSVFLVTGILSYRLAYTAVDMAFAAIILSVAYSFSKELLRSFYITFLFMLIPFLVVNGILTGSGIANQVVWYNDAENLGVRLLTIPIEDIAYAFSLILLNLFLFEKFRGAGID